MKGSTRAATALAVGYLLGRRRKFRAATVMAAATAVGGTTVGGIAMRRGMKMLKSSGALGKVAPQLDDLVDAVRGDLLPAGKAAVASAASSRVDALTDSLHERAERVRNPVAMAEDAKEGAQGAARGTGRAAKDAGGRAAGAAGGATRRVAGRRRRADDEEDEYRADDEEHEYRADDEEHEYRADDEAGETEDYEPEEPEYDEDQDDYPEDAEDAEDAEDRQETAGRGRRTRNERDGNGRKPAAARRSPVTRTGR